MRISVLLPYKENFSRHYAGAVSLFVKDTTLNSVYTKNIFVFGNTKYQTSLLKNYVNIGLDNLFFQSKSKNYVYNFINKEKTINSDVIEIHNRPNYIKYLKSHYKKNKKIILYYHNDPLTMNGSKLKSDRITLLNDVDAIIFNSKWSQKRFFSDLPNQKLLEQKTSVCYQSTSVSNIDFTKKKKIISFIGKLNRAKGYDLFGSAIIKVLNNHKDWKAIVIGDEHRENINFYHKNLILMGFKEHQYILNLLKKISISVICSRWEEPFGRTSLEASSRGSAVIISNRGGLPETTSKPIILKDLTVKTLVKEIEILINNPKKLLKLQKDNLSSFKFNHDYISKLIDKTRDQFIKINNINLNIGSKKSLKILHITNFNERFDGRLHYNTGRRINNGLIKLGHNVLSLSDRDLLSNNKSITDIKGEKYLQSKILNTYNNFKADLVLLGHADKVSINTLDLLKNKNHNLKFSQWFLDPLSKKGPDYLNNKKRILDKIGIIDKSFLTTYPGALDFKIPNSNFIPNPCDESFEILKNYNKDCEFDIFFAMSHGVHRGKLKKGKNDNRELFINRLIKKNLGLRFDVYGMNNVQPIWGDQFIENIANSYMALNLSRGKPIKYYSSDRIAQLLGNGLLTFIDKRTELSDFFNNDEMIFYNDNDDLIYKLLKYKSDKKIGKIIAKNGRKKYHKFFNSVLVSKFIIDKTFDLKTRKKYIWDK